MKCVCKYLKLMLGDCLKILGLFTYTLIFGDVNHKAFLILTKLNSGKASFTSDALGSLIYFVKETKG